LITLKRKRNNTSKNTLPPKTEMGFGVDYRMGTHKWHGAAAGDEQLEVALLQLPATVGDY